MLVCMRVPSFYYFATESEDEREGVVARWQVRSKRLRRARECTPRRERFEIENKHYLGGVGEAMTDRRQRAAITLFFSEGAGDEEWARVKLLHVGRCLLLSPGGAKWQLVV